jgi:nucleoside 2-deoxyribosyltransferase
MARPRVYLAGPDVFLRDPGAFAQRKKALCERYGFEGVFPLDGDLKPQGPDLRELGLAISRANEGLIRGCQLVIAQMTPFRGPSADVGTAYEMGFARACGLPVFAYSNVAEDFTTRTTAFVGTTHKRPDGHIEDGDQMQLEAFNLVDNLMLYGAIVASGGTLATSTSTPAERYTKLEAFEQCVAAAAKVFATGLP